MILRIAGYVVIGLAVTIAPVACLLSDIATARIIAVIIPALPPLGALIAHLGIDKSKLTAEERHL